MAILSIDIETYSDVDLSKCGVYAYSDSPNFEILLFAYAFDEEPTRLVDLACGERLPERVLAALEDPAITKAAFNAQFERTCISKYLEQRLSPSGWQCTAVQSAMLALPLSLDSVGEVLDIQRKKLKEGVDLVRFFSMPCKPTKSNGGRTRNRPEDAPEKWERFKTYCIRDVDAEREIRQKLWKFPIPDAEMELYRMDQEINDRGILVDQQLVENAVLCDNQYREMVTARAYELTGLSNPNSPVQIKGWLAEHGVEAEKLDKKTVKGLLTETDGEVLEVLKLRLLMAKTSVKKYEAIERSVCLDGRVHGLLQFYGANRTGRWAGRLVQVQNLPQNHIPDLDLARSLVKEQRFEDLDLLYESTPEVLSELIRTAFVPKPGCRFIVADFSAIEARVLAWFAGEQWRLHTFAEGGDIYCASASKMFGVPVVKHGVNGHLRQKGKIAELALGYGGAVGALTSMGALDMGLQEEELQPLVSQCYGKRDRAGVRKLLGLGSGTALALAAALYLVVFGFTDALVAIFNSENSALMARYAFTGMRIYFIGYLFAGFNIVSSGYLSAVNRPTEASITSISRGVVAIVACSLVLSALFGMNGVWAAFPASEAMTVALTLFLLRGKRAAD